MPCLSIPVVTYPITGPDDRSALGHFPRNDRGVDQLVFGATVCDSRNPLWTQDPHERVGGDTHRRVQTRFGNSQPSSNPSWTARQHRPARFTVQVTDGRHGARRLVWSTPSGGAGKALSGNACPAGFRVQGPLSFPDPRCTVNDEADAPSLPGGTLARYPPPPLRHVKAIGILAVLVAAATAMALTACTTAAPDNPGSTSTSMPVSTSVAAVTPTAGPGTASASAASAASSPSAAADAAAASSTTEQPTEQSVAEQSAAEHSSPPAGTATAVVNVAAADAAGVPMPGFTVVDDQGSNSPVDCSFGAPNPAAVGVNTHDCSPHAASAHFCWGTTGTVDLLCSWDPRSTELHRYTAMEPLTDTAAAADPVPWGLDLADGRKCDVRLGGAFSGRPDDYTVAYVCGGATATYVLRNSTDPVVDTSGPQWVVKVGGLSHNPTVTSLPPPVAIGVVAAYFAATG